MATRELNWSSFIREPSQVESLLEQGDVVLKRRDGEPLLLSRHSKSVNLRQTLWTAVQLLGARKRVRVTPKSELGVTDRLPWTRFLPEQERDAFVTEFVSHLEACADLGEFSSLGRLLEEWKNTAVAYAEDGVAPKLKKPLKEVGGPVPRPGR